MQKSRDEGGNLEVTVEAKWDAHQQSSKDHFRARVKHTRETY